MPDIDPALRQYIETQILPQYEGQDGAHGPDHVQAVIHNSLELAQGLPVDMNMVYAIAAYHDIGIRFGRKDHHLTSGKWLWEDESLPRWFSPEQRRIMREAVEDHRASGKEPPRSVYGRIVSEADRELDPLRVIRRTLLYGLANWPHMNDEEQIARSVEHIQKKYGEEGYLHLWMPSPRNEAGLSTLRAWLRTGEIKAICYRILQEEKNST